MKAAFCFVSVMNGMKTGMNKQKPLVLCMQEIESYPLPLEFIARIGAQFGDSANTLLSSLDSQAPVSVRLNPALYSKLSTPSIYPGVNWCAEGFYLPERPVFGRDPLFHAGAYYVQEASSMAAGHLFARIRKELPQSGLLILDACAAPGGKSTHLLAEMHEEDLLTSNEFVKSRYPALTENLVKWGYANQIITQCEPGQLMRAGLKFDVILADAPCSGEGLFRKDPESRLEWSESQVEVCAARQKGILSSLIPMLNPGGVILYSTCTYAPEENEGQMQFLHDSGLKCITPVSKELVNWEQVTAEPGLIGWRARPDYVQGEGFFITVFQNTGSMEPHPDFLQNVKEHKQKKHKPLPEPELLPFEVPYTLRFQKDGDGTLRIEHKHTPILRAILESAHIPYRSGLKAGLYKSNKFIPDAELAFWKQLSGDIFPRIDLNHADAMRYLRREVLNEVCQPDRQGFHLICHQGMGMGWANLSGNRFNNGYPMHWRLRDSSESPLIPFPEQEQ
jgi:16S rRNA C967 or C1407 C5-methylase (RsmB/RsmF family)/NOL1/NOP2/fmu family ribosome biogenesis protein